MMWKVKFFGSTDRHVQVKQVKMIVEAPERDKVEEVLRHKMYYQVINGLKITQYVEGNE